MTQKKYDKEVGKQQDSEGSRRGIKAEKTASAMPSAADAPNITSRSSSVSSAHDHQAHQYTLLASPERSDRRQADRDYPYVAMANEPAILAPNRPGHNHPYNHRGFVNQSLLSHKGPMSLPLPPSDLRLPYPQASFEHAHLLPHDPAAVMSGQSHKWVPPAESQTEAQPVDPPSKADGTANIVADAQNPHRDPSVSAPAVFRRFTTLHHRIISQIQSDLATYESQLISLEQRIKSYPGPDMGYLQALQDRRRYILTNVFEKLEQYHAAIALARSDTTLNESRASERSAFGPGSADNFVVAGSRSVLYERADQEARSEDSSAASSAEDSGAEANHTDLDASGNKKQVSDSGSSIGAPPTAASFITLGVFAVMLIAALAVKIYRPDLDDLGNIALSVALLGAGVYMQSLGVSHTGDVFKRALIDRGPFCLIWCLLGSSRALTSWHVFIIRLLISPFVVMPQETVYYYLGHALQTLWDGAGNSTTAATDPRKGDSEGKTTEKPTEIDSKDPRSPGRPDVTDVERKVLASGKAQGTSKVIDEVRPFLVADSSSSDANAVSQPSKRELTLLPLLDSRGEDWPQISQLITYWRVVPPV
ncbi:Hypothetical protein D9617_24g017380 [Elsinoe fawcettii]|nr:Hypothetical protein D9617_24g017380 [Elsinoe fawcettii]